MFPYLFKYQSFLVSTYFVLMTVGFLVGFFIAIRESSRLKVPHTRAVDLCIVVYLSALFGSRVLHVMIEPSDFYREDWTRVFAIWTGGFVFYGGLAVAFVSAVLFCRWVRIPLQDASDFAAPALAIGHAVGRIGCFGAGCCHGAPTDWIWGVVYSKWPGVIALPPVAIPLHPTQLIESLNGFLLGGALLYLNRRRPVPGIGMILFALEYSIMRFLVEFLRGDAERGAWGALSTSQWISIPTALVAAGALVVILKRNRN